MNLKKEMLALTPKLRAYAWVLSGGAPAADDLVQETLLRAWQARHSLESSGNLKAWMFRILRTVFLASVAGGLKSAALDSGLVREAPGEAADPSWRARFGDLIEALGELPGQDCEALLLVAGSGLTYEEAAEVCYCSAGVIKSRVTRARERLALLVDARPASAVPPAWAGRAGARLAS
jgi:RNA polymerase sigma-70 factor (ECF subfamily)